MTFTAGVPLDGQSLGASKVPIRNNLTRLRSAIEINHVDINDATNYGKHKFLQMPEQGAAPTTAVNEGGLYTKVGTTPAQTNLFFRGESSGFEYQLTKAIAASTGTFASNTGIGWTFLPGALIFQFGFIVPAANPGATPVTYPVIFPSGQPAHNIQVTAATTNSSGDQTAAVRVGTSTANGFSINTSSSGNVTLFYWTAIGY